MAVERSKFVEIKSTVQTVHNMTYFSFYANMLLETPSTIQGYYYSFILIGTNHHSCTDLF